MLGGSGSGSGSSQAHAQVLVVDDTTEIFAKPLTRILTMGGIKCKTVLSLKEAMDSLDNCKVLITDFDLNAEGSENSLPLVKKAKELGIYVIQMSGDIERAKGTITMADEYLSKSHDQFDFMAIRNKVKAALEKG